MKLEMFVINKKNLDSVQTKLFRKSKLSIKF